MPFWTWGQSSSAHSIHTHFNEEVLSKWVSKYQQQPIFIFKSRTAWICRSQMTCGIRCIWALKITHGLRRHCFMRKSNCFELQGDLRVWALLLHDFMVGVWSVIISNVINTFYMGAGRGGHFVWTCVFYVEEEKTDNYILVGRRGAVSPVVRSQTFDIYEWWVAFVTAKLPLPQHYNCLVNILAANIDYLANPITEPAIDPLASSPTIGTLSKETLNSTCTIGSLTA